MKGMYAMANKWERTNPNPFDMGGAGTPTTTNPPTTDGLKLTAGELKRLQSAADTVYAIIGKSTPPKASPKKETNIVDAFLLKDGKVVLASALPMYKQITVTPVKAWRDGKTGELHAISEEDVAAITGGKS